MLWAILVRYLELIQDKQFINIQSISYSDFQIHSFHILLHPRRSAAINITDRNKYVKINNRPHKKDKFTIFIQRKKQYSYILPTHFKNSFCKGGFISHQHFRCPKESFATVLDSYSAPKSSYFVYTSLSIMFIVSFCFTCVNITVIADHISNGCDVKVGYSRKKLFFKDKFYKRRRGNYRITRIKNHFFILYKHHQKLSPILFSAKSQTVIYFYPHKKPYSLTQN